MGLVIPPEAWNGCDSETAPISPGCLAPPLACVSYCDYTLSPGLLHWTECFEFLRDLLKNKAMVFHNGPYDLCVFAAQFPELLELVFQALFEHRVTDTMLNQRLIDIARGELNGYHNHHGVWIEHAYSLSDLSRRYGFGAMEKDEWRLSYGHWREFPLAEWPEGAREYPKKDALRPLQVLYKQLEFSEFLADSASQCRAAFALQLQSCRGMITDARACQDFIDATKIDIERAKGVLLEEKIMRPNGKKDTKAAKARMERVCLEIGIPVPKTKKTKASSENWKPGTALDAESTRNTGDSVLMDYSLYTSADKALTVAETIQKGSTGVPLQTSYMSLMETGRISSRAPNLTNLPRKPGIRECFIPRPGFVFCSLDLDMAEAIGVAQIHHWMFGRSTLGDALNNKKDIHCMLAAEMLGCSYEEVLANKKVGKYKKARQNAKFGNYGLWGGMGIPKFVATTNATIEAREDKITPAIGQQVKTSWKNTWAPESEDYFEEVKKMLGQGGMAWVRQYISGRIRGRLDYCQAANTLFQGLIADLIKAALLPIQYEMYCAKTSPLFGSRMLLDLHDELFAELLEERAHEAAMRMKEILLGLANEVYTPDVEMTGEPSLMRRWWKDAPSLYVNGELVPAKPQVEGKDVILVKKNDAVVWVPDLAAA